MINRKTIAAIAIAAASASPPGPPTRFTAAPALAGDADARFASRLLEEARTFGVSDVRGTAAGEVARERSERRDDTHATSVDEKRWHQVQKSQSLN